MSDAPTPQSVSPSSRGVSLPFGGHGVEVAGQDQALAAAERGAGHDVVADALDVEPGAGAQRRLDQVGERRLVPAERGDRHQLPGGRE